MQFELLTTYLNDGGKLPERGSVRGAAHAYLSAPYGIYKTQDSYLAIAMGNLIPLLSVLDCAIDDSYDDTQVWFNKRDEIMKSIADVLVRKTTEETLELLEPLGIWCSPVLNYQQLTRHEGYKVLGMEQQVKLATGEEITTTRSPIVINRNKMYSSVAAPRPGAQTAEINKEFSLL